MLARARLVKQCIRCGAAYTDTDNLDLPCMIHPGSWHRDNMQAGHRFWSCCGRTTELVGTDMPCTPAAHDSVVMNGAAPPLTIVPYPTGEANETELRIAHPAVSLVVVSDAAQLRTCVGQYGTAITGHPDYPTLTRYINLSIAATDATSRYFVPRLPGGYEPDEIAMPAMASAPRRQLCFAIATAYDMTRLPQATIASNLLKTAKHAPHLIRL
ncbi:MAG: hypothetical protein M0R22_10585, partial [Dehalococcoidia bacterium]|nr:hypothetical protein [Dehalococcoidia bacterium]